jgi:hypothetical protein
MDDGWLSTLTYACPFGITAGPVEVGSQRGEYVEDDVANDHVVIDAEEEAGDDHRYAETLEYGRHSPR